MTNKAIRTEQLIKKNEYKPIESNIKIKEFYSKTNLLFKTLKGPASIGLMLWFLAREVLRLRGTLTRNEQWEVMPDLFFYRDHEQEAKTEEPAAVQAEDQYQAQAEAQEGEWDGTTIGQNVQLQSGFAANEDWNPAEDNWNKGASENWSAAAPAQGQSWAAQ